MRFKTIPFLAAFALLSSNVCAQDSTANYPSKPMTWVVPFAAGGPTDALARHIAERVGTVLKQTIIIDNAPGAGAWWPRVRDWL